MPSWDLLKERSPLGHFYEDLSGGGSFRSACPFFIKQEKHLIE
jgi:hypothetical protein